MKEVRIKDEYIKLCQALKFAGMVENVADATFEIQDGLVEVNGEVELQRGKKLRNGDIVEYHGEEFTIVSPFK